MCTLTYTLTFQENTKLETIIYKQKASKTKIVQTKRYEKKNSTKVLLSSFCVGLLLLGLEPTFNSG